MSEPTKVRKNHGQYILMIAIGIVIVVIELYTNYSYRKNFMSVKAETTIQTQQTNNDFSQKQQDIVNSYIDSLDKIQGLLVQLPTGTSQDKPSDSLINDLTGSINDLKSFAKQGESLHQPEQAKSSQGQNWEMFNSFIALYADTLSYAVDDYKNGENSKALDFIKLANSSLSDSRGTMNFNLQDASLLDKLGSSINKILAT